MVIDQHSAIAASDFFQHQGHRLWTQEFYGLLGFFPSVLGVSLIRILFDSFIQDRSEPFPFVEWVACRDQVDCPCSSRDDGQGKNGDDFGLHHFKTYETMISRCSYS